MTLARLEIVELRARLAAVAPEKEDLRRQVVAARHQAELYRRQLAVLRTSSSWRITKPLRLIRRRSIDE